MSLRGGRHLQQRIRRSLTFGSGLVNLVRTLVVCRSGATFVSVRRFTAGYAMLRLLVAGEAVRIGKRLAAHLAREDLFTPAIVNRLVVGSEMKMMPERLPTYCAGVETRRMRWGVGVLGFDILRVRVIGGGAWDMVLTPVLDRATLRIWVKAVQIFCRCRCRRDLFIFPLLVELAVPTKTLRIAKLFSTNGAFIIFCTGVDSLMFAQMKGLSEKLATDCAVVRLFPCVNAVVPAQGLTARKPFTTYTAEVCARESAGAHSLHVLPTFGGVLIGQGLFLSSGFARTFRLSTGVLCATHGLMLPNLSVSFIHCRG